MSRARGEPDLASRGICCKEKDLAGAKRKSGGLAGGRESNEPASSFSIKPGPQRARLLLCGSARNSPALPPHSRGLHGTPEPGAEQNIKSGLIICDHEPALRQVCCPNLHSVRRQAENRQQALPRGWQEPRLPFPGETDFKSGVL